MKLKAVFTTLVVSVLSANVVAVPFEEIRIGDNDGFGYDVDPSFATLTGDGGIADRNSDGHLGVGDVLPSLNGDAVVATGSRDDFDNRNGESVNGIGFVDNGTSGVEYTDISLSTSYNSSSAAGNVYDANTGSYGAGGLFPGDGSSTSLSNQPGFVFNFTVDAADILAGTDIFFNMVFGDYDVTPAELEFVFASGSSIQAVTPQNNGPDDGLIQGAFAMLSFSDVFTDNGAGGWDGYVEVNFNAPREPYTAFDYVELSVEPLLVSVPEPSTLLLLMGGLFGVFLQRKRQAVK